MPVAGGWNLFLRQSGCYSHFPGARNRKETESGLGPSGKVLPCPFIHKSPSPLLLHDKCLIVLWWKISLINIILSPCGTLLLLQSPDYNVIYIETIKLVLKYECWDFRDKKSSPAAGEVVTVPVKNYNTFDKAIIVHNVQGGFLHWASPKMFKKQQS